MRSMYLFLVGIALFSQSCAQPQKGWEEYKKTFATDFKTELQSNKVVGASYAVFDANKLIWQDAYGFANKKTNDTASQHTKYLIGSVTKVFTAVAILQLHEKGVLSIDSCVSTYLPEFAIKQRFPDSAPITIRDVLTHHAGLPTDLFLHKFAAHPPRFEEVLNYLNSQSTCSPVGKIKSYSNIGYALLGLILERVSGMPYQEYVEKNIFSPLGMKNSGFYTTTDQRTISRAYNAEGVENEELPIFDVPAGAVYSDLEDMVNFGQSFLKSGTTILKPETIKLMFGMQNKEIKLDLFEKSAICFNYKNKAPELGRVLEHGGATMYHRAELYLAPDAGLGCIMLSNSTEGVKNAWKLNEEFMVEYSKHQGLKIPANCIPQKPFDFSSVKNKKLQSFVGDYAMPGMNCRFEWKNENLFVTIQGNSFYLLPADDHSFVAAKRVMGVMFKSKDYHFFLEEIDGEKLFIQAMPWGESSIIGKKIEKKSITPEWEKRIGKYEIVNQDSREVQMINGIEIIRKNGYLILKYKFNAISNTSNAAEMTLDLVDNTRAFTMGLGSGGGESVIFSKNGTSGDETFAYYGLQCRKQK